MDKQMIITLSREYGTGGHYIAEKLAEEFGILLLDHNMLDHISADKEVDLTKYKKYDESPRKTFLSRTVRGMSNSFEENLAEMQFDYIRKKADEGTSMIVVGRCAEYVLKDKKNVIKIFILGDMKQKVARIKKIYDISDAEAKKQIASYDRKRKSYHNYFADTKWGDSRNYDLCINSSKLGLDRTVEFLKDYIRKRVEC